MHIVVASRLAGLLVVPSLLAYCPVTVAVIVASLFKLVRSHRCYHGQCQVVVVVESPIDIIDMDTI